MNENVKKLLRTVQVRFPVLLEAKFGAMRLYRNAMRIPFESDFNALSLFPDIDGAVFLDVGANRGQSTDAILMKRAHARVHLFEPNEMLCGRLANLFSGRPGIVVHNFGLGDENAASTLYIPFYRRWMFDGLASFERGEAVNWLKDRIYFYDEAQLSVRRSKCRVRRLDDLMLSPFLIKLDVQGYEYRALKGGSRTLERCEPVLLIESPGSDVRGFLRDLRYEAYAFKGGRFVAGAAGGLNTFFMTRSKSRLVLDHITGVVP